MGPNSKRNQAAAQAAARNTLSRARFSKGPPNKRPASSGLGRGGGGRGGSAGDADKKDDADDEIRK